MDQMTPKEQRAYELRLSGKTFKEIAKELKYADASGAYQAYQRAREVVSLENLGEWRLLELERLNVIQSALWEKAMEGHIPTINALLRVFDLRAKLIGLYAPEKHQVQYEEPDYDLNDAVKDINEMVDLGVKYAEENGIETEFMRRKHKKENPTPWNLE
jgi:hypothetical protein